MIVIVGTAWLAIVAWAATNWLRALLWLPAARIVWTCGCVALSMHVMLAFSLIHGWDHDAAYRAVAHQTYERTGLDWGGGIYVNHAFTALWAADAVFWWVTPRRYLSRPRALDGTLQFVFLFMFVNATIIFGNSGAVVAAGAVVCAVGTLGWWRWSWRGRSGAA